MSYSDVRSMPLSYRRWYIERLIKHHKTVNKKNNPPSTQKNSSTSLMGVSKVPQSKDNKDDLKKVERFFKKFSK